MQLHGNKLMLGFRAAGNQSLKITLVEHPVMMVKIIGDRGLTVLVVVTVKTSGCFACKNDSWF